MFVLMSLIDLVIKFYWGLRNVQVLERPAVLLMSLQHLGSLCEVCHHRVA